MMSRTQTKGLKTRVYIVDDHPIVRQGLRLLLGLEPDLTVCGENDSAPAALKEMLALRPDVGIVDLSLKVGCGLELIKAVREQGLSAKLVVFTIRDGTTYAERVLHAGAEGFVGKEEGTQKVVDAIRTVMQGKRYCRTDLMELMLDRLVEGPSGKQATGPVLSDRELEVLELIGSGLGSSTIAQRLGVSLKTVQSHREHIKAKLGLSHAADLVRYAFNWCNREGEAIGAGTMVKRLAPMLHSKPAH